MNIVNLKKKPKMKTETKNALYEAWAYCDWKDKSTEFMIEYMKSQAKVSFDTVMSFLEKSTDEARSQWYKDNPQWYEKYPENENKKR